MSRLSYKATQGRSHTPQAFPLLALPYIWRSRGDAPDSARAAARKLLCCALR